jgi:hypothetical protein
MAISSTEALQCALVPCVIETLLEEARTRHDAPFCILAIRIRNARNVLYISLVLEIISTVGAVLTARNATLKGEYVCITFSTLFGLLTLLVTMRLYNTSSSLRRHEGWVLEDALAWRELEL